MTPSTEVPNPVASSKINVIEFAQFCIIPRYISQVPCGHLFDMVVYHRIVIRGLETLPGDPE